MFTNPKVTTSFHLHFPPCHIVYRDAAKDCKTMMYVLRCKSNKRYRIFKEALQYWSVYIGEKYSFEKCFKALQTERIFTEMYLLGKG